MKVRITARPVLQACGHAADVSIRSWALLDGGSVLLLSVRGSRWCERVGRQHRSNGVYYVVDLQQGWWTQKCFDPDCRWAGTAVHGKRLPG